MQRLSLRKAITSKVDVSLIVKNIAHLLRQQIRDIHDTKRLEEYWEKHRLQDGETSGEQQAESPLSCKAGVSNTQPNRRRLSRVVTDVAALTATPSLSAYHPALSLIDFTKSFGPLIFRLYRAALLRKRILLVGEAPVHQNCEFGKQWEDSSQMHCLTFCSLRPLYRVYRSEVTLIAPANRWYAGLPTTASIQCWSAGHSAAVRN